MSYGNLICQINMATMPATQTCIDIVTHKQHSAIDW
jgi:hypothetical protein